MSMLGIAREVAALEELSVNEPHPRSWTLLRFETAPLRSSVDLQPTALEESAMALTQVVAAAKRLVNAASEWSTSPTW